VDHAGARCARLVATKITDETAGGVNICMGKIIRLDSYRKDRQAMQAQHQRRRMHSGFAFAETALQIMLEEAHKRGHTDIPAIWYATARASIQALRHSGWTTEDLIKIVRDITRGTY